MHIYIYTYIYIYIYTHETPILYAHTHECDAQNTNRRVHAHASGRVCLDADAPRTRFCSIPWLRTNRVNTNGAAAKVNMFDRLGKSYALALLGRYK